MNWWDLFVWGYATDVCEYDEDEEYLEEDLIEANGDNITITIDVTIEENKDGKG